jgi:hypothetical protein
VPGGVPVEDRLPGRHGRLVLAAEHLPLGARQHRMGGEQADLPEIEPGQCQFGSDPFAAGSLRCSVGDHTASSRPHSVRFDGAVDQWRDSTQHPPPG